MTPYLDPHRSEERLASSLRRIKEDSRIHPVNKRLILNYLEFTRALGHSAGRRNKVAWMLRDLAQHISCPLRTAKQKDIQKLVAWINEATWTDVNGRVRPYSESVKSDFKKILKQFYRYIRYGNLDQTNPYPPEVRWVKCAFKQSELQEEDLVNEDDIKKMIDVAPTPMHKALVSVAYEACYRPGELLSMTVGSVAFNAEGVKIRMENSKTKLRDPLLINSAPLLARYLDSHPFKDLPDAPLWVGVEGPNKNRPLGYSAFSHVLKSVAIEAGVQKKRIWPYLFRHSGITRDAKNNFSETLLKIKHGWSKGSHMPARYIHIKDQTAVDAVTLNVYGGKVVKSIEPKYQPIRCPRCAEKNTSGQRHCGRCGSPLNVSEIVESDEEMASLRETVESLKESQKSMELRLAAVDAGSALKLLEEASKLPKGQRDAFFRRHGIVVD